MSQFRRLMWVALCSGAIAGSVLFALQQWTVHPLIEAAEAYEAEAYQFRPGTLHDDAEWHPSGGLERNVLTALATILMGVGFAAVLFGTVALARKSLTVGRGALWGLAGFACFAWAPALGLPPVPPGAAVAELPARQLWWIATVVATGTGLWLLASQARSWLARIAGVGCLLLPHAIGAPVATGENLVPAPLIRQFAIAVLASQAVFWLLLGTAGGFLYNRIGDARKTPHLH